MKVVILAAGKGSRLGDPDLPKPLIKLANGKSILQNQLDNLTKHIPIHNILVVVGFHKGMIMDECPDALFVYNPRFAQENTSKSLLKALNKVQDDLLWLNGDVVFHPDILETVLAFEWTGMVVNVGPVGEEEVKYSADEEGRILEVSKGVLNPRGEALGINFFESKDLDALRKNLELCQGNDYFEKGIEGCILDGIQVWSIPVDQCQCMEIDFPEDLEKANKLLESWQGQI